MFELLESKHLTQVQSLTAPASLRGGCARGRQELHQYQYIRHWNVTASVKRTQRKMRRKKTENQKLIRRESKVRHDLTFINPDAKRDGEDSVWRLLGPGTDSELIRPRCALRRDALTLRAGWKHGSRLTSLSSSKNLNETN